MKCFVCGSEAPGEVCNQCVRTERNLFHKDWDYKEGFIMKKVENYRVDVSSYRISGTGMISNSDKGLVARLDAFNHYVGNIESVEKKPYNGKDAVMIHYKNPNTQMERFIFFVNLNAEEGLRNAVIEAKKDLEASARASSMGMLSGGTPAPAAPAPTAPTPVATPQPAAPAQAPTQAPTPVAAAPNPAPAQAVSGDMAIKLKKLQVLLDSGILTQEEYDNEKRKMGF